MIDTQEYLIDSVEQRQIDGKKETTLYIFIRTEREREREREREKGEFRRKKKDKQIWWID